MTRYEKYRLVMGVTCGLGTIVFSTLNTVAWVADWPMGTKILTAQIEFICWGIILGNILNEYFRLP